MNKRYLIILYVLLLSCFGCQLVAQSIQTIDQFHKQAEGYYTKGDYDQALINYQKGYTLARKLNYIRAANLAVDISSIYHMQGNFRLGATICHEGETLLKRAPVQPDSVWFKLNSSLGEMYKKLNNQDSCFLYFSRANDILQKRPELEKYLSEYVMFHYNNQGMMYVRNGAYTEGLSYLTRAMAVAQKYTSSKENLAILQNNLGEIHERLGDFGKAMQLRKLAVENYPRNDFYKYWIYNGASWDALQNANYEEGISMARKVLSLSKTATASTDWRIISTALNRLGQNYYKAGHTKQATTYFKEAIKYQKRIGVNRDIIIASSYMGLAKILNDEGNPDKALDYCQQAIIASHQCFSSTNILLNPTVTNALSELGLFEALKMKAELFGLRFGQRKKIADLQYASITYQRALDVADVIRKSYNTLETKWFFSSQIRPSYAHAFEAAYTLYTHTRQQTDKAAAFTILERSKGAALADINRESLIKPANVPEELVRQELDLQRIITAQKLASTANRSSEWTAAQIKLAQLQQRFEKEFPAYNQAKYQLQPVQLSQLQHQLDERMAYLNYILCKDAIYISVVTRNELTIVRKEGDMRSFKTTLATLDSALYKNPGLGNYKASSAAITTYRWLIEPITHLLPNIERLVISRDGELHRLPFEVLETGRRIDDYLIKKYAISYVPSANTLLRLVAGEPTDNTLLGLAPFVAPTEPDAPRLDYLPASQAEAEQLPGEALLGKMATKARFLRNYSNYTMLHFATHAYADNQEPARSYIAFYPDGNPDKLYAGEIYDLLLTHMRLAVLSACETGNGKIQQGEGVTSLAQAFLYAGCPSVVTTLWNAHDESAAYLAQRLYRHLQKGLPIDLALQKTRLDYFQSDLYARLNHPHYWGNLMLLGHSQPVYEKSNLLLGVWSIIILSVSVILLLFARRQSLPQWGRRRQLWKQISN